MKFIDKSLRKDLMNNLVSNFINSRWNPLQNSYDDIQYSGKNFSTSIKQEIKLNLIQEQNNLCCYCMKHIDNDTTTTLEHIIPQSTVVLSDFNKYTHIPLIRDNVILQPIFESTIPPLITPPFPHTIAYENLTASCDGKLIDGVPRNNSSKFCNNKRGNDLIDPLFFNSNIESEIEYKQAGLLVPINTSYISTIQNLNLNYDTLEKIRQVWYHISKVDLIQIENADTEIKRNTILTINLIHLIDVNRRNILISNFKTEQFWEILLKYKWFYMYYRNKYNVVVA